jgi:hypothetical protein
MFDQLRHFRASKQETASEATETTALQIATNSTIVTLHNDTDSTLFLELLPHLETLALRFPGLFAWKHYQYPPAHFKGESKHEAFISDLQTAFLFLPCTSAPFLTRFLQARQKDERLGPLLSRMYVQPLPFHACHGVSQTLLADPLSAYEGSAREEACVRVVEALEQKLLRYLQRQGRSEAPITLLQETASARK